MPEKGLKAGRENCPTNLGRFSQEPPKVLYEKFLRRQELSAFIINYLFTLKNRRAGDHPSDDLMVDFSVHDVLKAYQDNQQLGKRDYQIKDVEDCIFYLSYIGAMQIEGGFLVIYNPMTIHRVEEDTRRKYKKEDYKLLDLHYFQKMQQIHIVGEYARKMVKNYKEALQFVEDYFHRVCKMNCANDQTIGFPVAAWPRQGTPIMGDNADPG